MRMRFKWIGGILAIALIVTVAVQLYPPTRAEGQVYPKFTVCIYNQSGQTIRYQRGWSTRNGEYFDGYKLITIAPGQKATHTGPRGKGRLNIRIHTGGSQGVYKNFYVNGTAGNCDYSSSAAIRYNERGFLRLYNL